MISLKEADFAASFDATPVCTGQAIQVCFEGLAKYYGKKRQSDPYQRLPNSPPRY